MHSVTLKMVAVSPSETSGETFMTRENLKSTVIITIVTFWFTY